MQDAIRIYWIIYTELKQLITISKKQQTIIILIVYIFSSHFQFV